MKKKIFITGVAGFIGSKLAEYILDNHSDEYEVWGIDDLSGGFLHNLHPDINFKNTSNIPSFLLEHFEQCQPDIVYHAAAYAAEGLSPFIREYNYTNNVVLTAKIVNLCITHKVKRLVFFSSIAVYGGVDELPYLETMTPKPIDPYGVAKYACEMDIQIAGQQHGLDWCIVRPANVYGPNQNLWDNYRNVLGIWLMQSKRLQPMRVFGNGTQCRAFTYIDDIVHPLFIAGTSASASKKIFNLVSNKLYSINDALSVVKRVTGWNEVDYQEERHEAKIAWSDSSESQKYLGFNPTTTLLDGFSKMYAWSEMRLRDCESALPVWTPRYEITEGMYASWKKT